MDISKNIDWQQSEHEMHTSAAFGHAVRLLASSSQHRGVTVHSLAGSLWPAIRLGQIEFLFNSKGSPVAFATWAYVTAEIAELIAQDHAYRLDISEWNEGDQLWIMDLVAPFGDLRNLVRKLRTAKFGDVGRVHGLRRRANGRASRIVALTLSMTRPARNARGPLAVARQAV